jgi:hypothetical protein
MTVQFLCGLIVALLCSACGNSPSTTSPSTTSTTPSRTTELFTGNLAAGDSQFYSFTVGQSGTTDITLVSLTPAGTARPALTNPVGLGIGTPAGTGCSLSTALTAQPGLAAQLSTSTPATTYCVDIYDIGSVTAPVAFTIRIVHP